MHTKTAMRRQKHEKLAGSMQNDGRSILTACVMVRYNVDTVHWNIPEVFASRLFLPTFSQQEPAS